MGALMTTERSFDLQEQRGSLMCLAYPFLILHVIHGCLYNQALADVRLESCKKAASDLGLGRFLSETPVSSSIKIGKNHKNSKSKFRNRLGQYPIIYLKTISVTTMMIACTQWSAPMC